MCESFVASFSPKVSDYPCSGAKVTNYLSSYYLQIGGSNFITEFWKKLPVSSFTTTDFQKGQSNLPLNPMSLFLMKVIHISFVFFVMSPSLTSTIFPASSCSCQGQVNNTTYR